MFTNPQAFHNERFLFDGPQIPFWPLPPHMMQSDSAMERVHNDWSKEIYTCRIDYSHYNSQYA
jgi:hypothetical protein